MSRQQRCIKLNDCGISGNMKKELEFFCLQYGEKKLAIKKNTGIEEIKYCVRAKTDRKYSHTEKQAIYNVSFQNDIDLIDKTAKDVDPIIAPYLLKNVTQKIPYEYLDVPVGRTEFYARRTYFFLLLAERRYGVL